MSETEKRNPKSEDIDTFSTEQALYLMNEEDAEVIGAVKSAIPSIARAIDEAVEVIKSGGRIFYAGAGTSGRLGVLDASEMPPTFGVPADLFQAIIAGGDEALRKSTEGAEDDEDAGKNAASSITDKDLVIGISASGKTPFVLSCLDKAKERGAKCWLITCNDIEVRSQKSAPPPIPPPLRTIPSEGVPPIPPPLRTFPIDGVIKILTGPEIIAGSTRLKAGTATKLALNMFSTATMIKLGRVYKGLMVDVVPSNKKLIERAENIIMEVTGCSRKDASKYLKLSGMKPKVAIVMKKKGLSRVDAEKLLTDSEYRLRDIIG